MQNKKFTLVETILCAIAIAILGALIIPNMLPKIQAQPYYTNTSGQAPGAWQYNQSYPTPLKPSQTLANQYAAGTLAGYIPTNSTPFYFVTNSFTTNIFSAPPFVVVSADTNGIPATNNVARICATTTSNFVCQVLATNCGIYWEATGH